MCNSCQIKDCGVLNPSECPINKLWDREEQFAYVGISSKNRAYWMFLDNKVAHPQAIENTIPYQVEIWLN